MLADRHGACVHLGERECSLQRRHQKVVEEAPSPAVDGALRAQMGEAAVALALATGYEGAGTVELVLGDEGFFFLEMNTRLQVEHPVTEAVFGVDLVEEQLRIAARNTCDWARRSFARGGMPSRRGSTPGIRQRGSCPSGRRSWRGAPPAGEGIRVDAGVRTGVEVTGHYDPLLAKVIAHGPDRPTALARLDRALASCAVLGVATSTASRGRCWRTPTSARATWTRGCERRLDELVTPRPTTSSRPPRSRHGSVTRRSSPTSGPGDARSTGWARSRCATGRSTRAGVPGWRGRHSRRTARWRRARRDLATL